MLQRILPYFLIFCSFDSLSQSSDFGNWLIYFGNKDLKNRLNWHNEVQYRNYNFVGDTEQLLLRTGLGYNLTENNNNLLLGYGYIYSEPYLENGKRAKINEHRIYQQFITKQFFGRVSLQHRYRFEQRFLADQTRFRWRYFLGSNVALNHPKMQDKTVYLSIYNEIFVNTKNNYFDRNRFYTGMGYRFNEILRTELGMLNQKTSLSSRSQLNIISFLNF